jgi:hypothetical protein
VFGTPRQRAPPAAQNFSTLCCKNLSVKKKLLGDINEIETRQARKMNTVLIMAGFYLKNKNLVIVHARYVKELLLSYLTLSGLICI